MIEKCARRNGVGVIYVEQNPARGKYLFRRDMRKCVNTYMGIVLEEAPLKENMLNSDNSF